MAYPGALARMGPAEPASRPSELLAEVVQMLRQRVPEVVRLGVVPPIGGFGRVAGVEPRSGSYAPSRLRSGLLPVGLRAEDVVLQAVLSE